MMEPTPGAPERILAALLEARAGHALTADRMWRIETVLQPILREKGYPSLEALVVALASETDRRLVDEVVDALINHETYFFRDYKLFEDLDRVALEQLRTRRSVHKHLSIWSVGCSTGQEPYSLAMMFAESPERWAGWDIRILATDISPSVITRARAGRYSHFEIQRGLPARSMLNWFEADGSDWLLRGTIRDRVRFSEHNVLSDALPPGPFDLILCRNMLFYLTAAHRQRALARLGDALAHDGLFMLGAFETMIGQESGLAIDPEARGFYRAQTGSARPMGHLSVRYILPGTGRGTSEAGGGAGAGESTAAPRRLCPSTILRMVPLPLQGGPSALHPSLAGGIAAARSTEGSTRQQ